MSNGRIVAIDTSGRRAVVALGEADGTLVAADRWVAGYRHGEELLPRLDALLAAAETPLAGIGAIAVGTGPGAFTGLRVGLSTAKALASGLGVPIAGVATAEALLSAAAAHLARPVGELALLLPAGPSDRVLVVDGAARLIHAGTDPDLGDSVVVAVDLDGRAPADALAIGEAAAAELPAWLVRLAAGRFASSAGGDDVARLVPEYVTLPRGIAELSGEVKWSLSPR